MRRLVLISLSLLLAAAWVPASAPERPAARQVKLNGHTFTLPAGFEIELVAGPPLVDRPITADFDERGRLYVAESSGSNEKVDVQLQKKPHRILRLEDTDGDGRFDRRTVFADKMMFPEGTLWHAGSLYVAAPPQIWKLTDTDGDGVADRREVWFDGKTLTGCANDLHGPYLGPDGWIYWCKGAFAKQTYERPGKAPLVTRAAHVFRRHPDGGPVEAVMTGGMDNPVDLVFTPGGERIFTTTFLQFPAGGKRDGLIHAVYGGAYGKDWEVVREHPFTGPDVMPVLSHLGAAAPCGLHRYESDAFGPDYRDNLFACLFNMHKVTRHVLTPDGATFKSRDSDFLVSDNKDFHPTDVIEDADGSLLVVDTGGWYKLCCPTSQLVKPDVLGAIYRVRKTGAQRVEDPRGTRMPWAKMTDKDLVGLLDDARPAVKWRAVQALAARGAEAVPALAELVPSNEPPEGRRSAVWALTRIDAPPARAAAARALGDPDESVRQTAIHSAAVWRHGEAFADLVKLLHGPSAQNRRAAAEALGRIGRPAAVPSLLQAAGRGGNRFEEHSIVYALIEINDPEATAAGLDSQNVRTRRAALIALDQMPDGKLSPSAAVKELSSPDPAMREAAWWIVGRHPEWGVAVAGVLRERLADPKLSGPAADELAGHLAKLARSAAVQGLLAERLRDADSTPAARQVILRAMARANLKEAPAAWAVALSGLVTAEEKGLAAEAVATARALRLPTKGAEKLSAELVRASGDAKLPATVRVAALAAVPGGLAEVDAPVFDFLRGQLAREQPAPSRSAAADVLARARLSQGQLLALAGTLKGVSPMEVDRLLDAFARVPDDKVGQGILAALKASPAKAALRVEMLKPRLAKFGPGVRKEAEELYAALEVGTAKQRAKLEEMVSTLEKGDVRRGMLVFNGTKAACASCHAIGYLGGKVGPDLTRIGGIRTERDLLEAIVFPGASFVRSYESVVVTTRDGKVHNGVLRGDGPDEVVLAVNAEQEVRVARDDIEDMQPSQVSVMPSGLDQQLTRQELADLVAFLKACR